MIASLNFCRRPVFFTIAMNEILTKCVEIMSMCVKLALLEHVIHFTFGYQICYRKLHPVDNRQHTVI
jgi:hypothetical protein